MGFVAPRRLAAALRYEEMLAQLYALQSLGMRFGAMRMKSALALRGHPERGQVFVHIAGSNGKGSVSAMVEAALRAAGYRTGLFTSPHLHRFVERVRVAGKPISEREAARRVSDLLAASEAWGEPRSTFFELTALLALEAFRDHGCEVVVLEVGLGGRLDATNAVQPAVSVITRIALEHTDILGTTIPEIAAEKAGILKRGVPAISGVRDPAARAVIAKRARAVKTKLAQLDRDFEVLEGTRGRFGVRVGDVVLRDLRLALPGAHQRENAACACAALLALRAQGFAISDAAIRKGLARVRWPARLERVPGRPSFLFDAAHNPDGCEVLAAFLREHPARGRRVLVFGALADKQYGAMLRSLRPHVDRIFFSAPPIRRAASAAQLRRHAKGAPTATIEQALARARAAAGPGGEVIVAGSIFLVATARAQVLKLRSDPPIRM